MRISYWSSDVCSSDLRPAGPGDGQAAVVEAESGQRRGMQCPLRGQPQHGAATADLPEIGGEEAGGARGSEEGRGGEEWVSTWRCRWSTYHVKNNTRYISKDTQPLELG